MQRSSLIAGFALLLACAGSGVEAKPLRTGLECRPAVPDATSYAACRIAVTSRGEVCRCSMQPRAISSQAAPSSAGGPVAQSESYFDGHSRGESASLTSAAPEATPSPVSEPPRHSDPMPAPAT